MKSSEDKGAQSYFSICTWVCREPKFIFRVVFLTIASILTLYQITSCGGKLANNVDGTHLTLEINQTLHYPAVTFCRDPPFSRPDSVKDLVRSWEESSLEQNTSFSDFIDSVAFKMEGMENSVTLGPFRDIKVISTFSVLLGQCHTYVPLSPAYRVGKLFGYNISLTYDTKVTGETPPGWHIYIHDANHEFHDHCTTDGRSDYYFLNVGETVEAKIKPRQFRRTSQCKSQEHVAACFQTCVYEKLVKKLECQAPWMEFEGVEVCSSNGDSFSSLLSFGSNASFISHKSCECPRTCSFTNFDIFVEKAIKTPGVLPSRRSHLSIYYSTNTILVATETNLYNFPQFLADIGGGLAFFLGLSLLSIGAAFEKAFRVMFCPKPPDSCDLSPKVSRRASLAANGAKKRQQPYSSEETLTTSVEELSSKPMNA